jgi:two-component system, sensor histidine kinase
MAFASDLWRMMGIAGTGFLLGCTLLPWFYFRHVLPLRRLRAILPNSRGHDQADIAAYIGELQNLITKQQAELGRAAELSGHLAETTTKLKARFLSTLNHELRTPLNGVMGMTNLLLDTDLDKEQKSMVTACRESAENLLAMVNDILDFVRIDAGLLELESSHNNPHLLLQEIVDLLQPLAMQKNVQIQLLLPSPLPDTMVFDASRLRQVVYYLLRNGIKYTNNGFIKIHAAYADSGQGKMTLEIEDSGPGFDPEILRQWPNLLPEIASPPRRVLHGLGLSLLICRDLITAMGGKLELGNRPAPYTGSIVKFHILGRVIENTLTQKIIRLPIMPKNRYRILVAEDNRVNQALLQAYLQKQGHSVDIAADGKEAITLLQTNSYDLVLMDIQMPHMDGIATTEWIRNSHLPIANLPIIAVTANTMELDESCYAELGMDGLVTKPVDFGVLEQAMTAALAKRSLGKTNVAKLLSPTGND